MKSAVIFLRAAIIFTAAISAFLAENAAKGYSLPRTPTARPVPALPPPPPARPDVLDWTGPTRQATIWR